MLNLFKFGIRKSIGLVKANSKAKGYEQAPPKLAFEQLEDRVVPATFDWAGQANDTWINPQSWRVNGAIPANAPGPADIARFTNANNNPSKVDANFGGAVLAIELAGYTGTITLERAVSANRLELRSGTIAGAFPIAISGSGAWSGGRLVGNGVPTASSLVIGGNATFDFSGNLDLAGRVIRNDGTINWIGNSTVATSAGGSIFNFASGAIIKQKMQNVATVGTISGTGAFFNSGFVQAEPDTSVAFDVPVTGYEGSFLSDGEINFNASATFAGGAPAGAFTANLSGDGKIKFGGASSLFVTGALTSDVAELQSFGNASFSATGPQASDGFTLLDGAATFSGSTTISGMFIVDIGTEMEVNGPTTISGATGLLRVEPGSELIINAALTIDVGNLVNEGDISWQGGNMLLTGAGKISNLQGEVRVSGNAGQTLSGDGSFLNSGGLLSVRSSLVISTDIKVESTIEVRSGDLTINRNVTVDVGGELRFRGGNVIVNGSLTNNGTVEVRRDGQFTVNTFTNNNLLSFDDFFDLSRVSALTILKRAGGLGGSYTQTADGVLEMSIKGLAGSDRLIVNGTATLDGRLVTDVVEEELEPVPIPLDFSWELISGNRVGQFGQVQQPVGFGFSAPTYNADGVMVQTPQLLFPGGQVLAENTILTLASISSNVISIETPNTNAVLEVTLEVDHGTLTLGNISGLTFSLGSGLNDAAMVFLGTIAEINEALDGLIYRPLTSYVGPDSLAIYANDAPATGGLYGVTAAVAIDILPKPSIGNRVWLDMNGSGIQDAGESGASGVSVSLYNEQWSWVASTTTDSSGAYLFSNLTPGVYRVMFGYPMNGTYSPKDQGGVDSLDSDVDGMGMTEFFTVAAQQHRTDIDAGIVPYPSIGDTVWNDANGNGIQDAGEAGVSGVYVSLYNSYGYYIASTTTDSNGQYRFNNVNPGAYRVQFSAPMGMVFTTKDAGADDSLDSDADASGYTAFFTVAAGQSPTSVDAGLVDIASSYGSIGNRVWNDTNGNGVQDAGESGASGIYVGLYNEQWMWIGSTTTDSAGAYLFSNVAPGNYRVMFGYMTNGTYSPKDQGGDDALDSDADGMGTTDLFNVAAQQNRTDIDAGIVPYPSIGNTVWSDADSNGIQDAGETGVSSVYVSLYNSYGYYVASTMTDGSGQYQFSNVYPGIYRVQFSAPIGKAFTTKDAGSDDGLDSDADASGYTGYFTVAAGQSVANIDAGLVTQAAPNSPPMAMSDSATTSAGRAITISVLANDTDPDGDTLTVTFASMPYGGTVFVNGNMTATFMPNPGFQGMGGFSYTISDGNGGSSTGVVYVTVTGGGGGPNQSPIAMSDSFLVTAGMPATFIVLGNDSDPDGDALTVLYAAAAANGSAVVNADSTITYTANAGYVGMDMLSYAISDGRGGTASTTVYITVSGGGMPNNPPIAMNDTAVTSVGVPVTISLLTNDSDPDGDPLAYGSVMSGLNGSVLVNSNNTVTYTPNTGFQGADYFPYSISDGRGGTSSAIAYVTVGQPQRFAGNALQGAGQTATDQELQAALAIAMAQWFALGVATDSFANVRVRFADLQGNLLGVESGNEILLDDDAAGYGWFADSTPASDLAFGSGANGDRVAGLGTRAAGHVDLLTVLAHELGHVLGYDSVDADGGIMATKIGGGVRRKAAFLA